MGAAAGCSGWNDQCWVHGAPCSIHRRMTSISCRDSDNLESAGGIRSSSSSLEIRRYNSLCVKSPGRITHIESSIAASVPSFVSNRRSASRRSASGPWQAKHRSDRTGSTSLSNSTWSRTSTSSAGTGPPIRSPQKNRQLKRQRHVFTAGYLPNRCVIGWAVRWRTCCPADWRPSDCLPGLSETRQSIAAQPHRANTNVDAQGPEIPVALPPTRFFEILANRGSSRKTSQEIAPPPIVAYIRPGLQGPNHDWATLTRNGRPPTAVLIDSKTENLGRIANCCGWSPDRASRNVCAKQSEILNGCLPACRGIILCHLPSHFQRNRTTVPDRSACLTDPSTTSSANYSIRQAPDATASVTIKLLPWRTFQTADSTSR